MTDPSANLLTMAAAGRGAEARTALLQQLASQESLDPTLQTLLSQAITQRTERAATDDADEGDDDAGRTERRHRAMRSLRRRFAVMQDELDELQDRNAAAAAALGACARCWGDDTACSECAGAGRPGSGRPDPELFDELVAPAVRRHSATRRLEPRTAKRPSPARERSVQ